MYIFNPEHDLCLANGDANFVPPSSSLKFGQDCSDMLPMLFPDEEMVVWGWNPELKQRLIRQGVDLDLLPDDAQLGYIRELSHRRYALAASEYVYSHSSAPGFLVRPVSEEIFEDAGVEGFVISHQSVVLKAPWSGSGKGLRWVSSDSITSSDRGWWNNVISRQGSVIAQRRERVVTDFAALFHVGTSEVSFVGYSLFNTSNGAYRSNILASDDYILECVSEYVPIDVIVNSVDLVREFILEHFLGKYQGYIGVDMFVSRDGNSFLLSPCVEINVRMTMGLVARKCFERFISKNGKGADGKYLMRVLHSSDSQTLNNDLSRASLILSNVDSSTSYAIAVFQMVDDNFSEFSNDCR